MSDSSNEEKQNFLRETILEKGYDTNQFVNFLTDKKGEGGADVSNWTMNDLKQVVKEFIKLNGGYVEEEPPKPEPKKVAKKVSMFDVMPDNKPKPQVQKPQSKPEAQPPQKKSMAELFSQSNNTSSSQTKRNTEQNKQETTKTEEPQKTNTNNAVTSNINVYKSYMGNLTGSDIEYGVIMSETKKCKPTETTDLSKHDNLKITITNHEKIDNGFFSKAYISYLITTYPVLYKVRRRYSDFVWLRTTLQNHFPSNVIPPIPKKNRMGADKFSDIFVLKRARGLEKFLNYLCKDPIIKNSQIFYDFLYIGAETDFNSKKKVYEKVKPLADVKDFRALDEKAKLFISAEKEGYLENIKDNANININILKKINNNFKLLFEEMNLVTNRMDEISQLWEKLYKASEKYYDNNTTCESYKQMSNLFKVWSKSLKEQNTVVNVDIREHFKYVRKNFHSIKDLANSIETYKNNYQKGLKNLISKKDELFRKGDPTKWELDPKEKLDMTKIGTDKKFAVSKMCPKETSNCINLKEFYGFFLNCALTEYERMRNLTGILDKTIINTNIHKLVEILGQFHSCVGEINSALDAASINKNNDNKCQLKRIPLDETFLK